MTDYAFEIAELKRRMDNMIRGGTIFEANYMAEPPVVRIQDGELTTGWLPFMTARANGQEVSWDAPEIGERVTVISPSGDMSNARVILGSLYCDAHPAPAVNPDVITRMHADGAHDTYNRELNTRTIQIPQDGALKIRVGGTVISATEDAVTITAPDITMTAENAITLNAAEIVSNGKVYLGGKAGALPAARKTDTINTTTKLIAKGSANVFVN